MSKKLERLGVSMNVKKVLGGLLLPVFLLTSFTAQAQVKVIPLTADITSIKWGNMTVSALHTVLDVNNAHNTDTISFFLANPKGAASQLAFESGALKYTPNLTLRGGADCMVSGIKVLMQGEVLRVVFAERKGEWFDEKKFDFTIYELVKGEQGVPGYPDIYFKNSKKVTTAGKYCDANMALDKEAKIYR
jgi:hypothetical protein